MTWPTSSAASLASEAIQTAVTLACLLVSLRTHSDALATRRRVLRNGENHGADVWTLARVRGSGSMLAVQSIFLTTRCYRLWLIHHGAFDGYALAFFVFGLAWTATSVLAATTSYLNMRTYRQLRDESR